MIHKVLSHGAKGNPFDYLLKKGRAVAAKVLRGVVAFCLATIKAAPYRQKYTSLVLSFAEELTPERERQIMDDYERVAFGGRAEEFARVWVRHREHGRTELHVVVANVHLPTGKRWSHYYDRADRKLFKAWQELTNLRYHLASPDAPERMRLADFPGKLPPAKKVLFEKLDALVCTGVARGQIRTRGDVIEALRAAGNDVKPSRNYIAVKPLGSEERSLRLRGKKYVDGFTLAVLLASTKTMSVEEEAERKLRYEKDFSEAMARRTAFVERVCRPRRRASVTALDHGIQESDIVLHHRLTMAPSESSPSAQLSVFNHQPVITNELNQHESGPGRDISESLRRIDEAARGALWAARAAALGAHISVWIAKIGRVVRRLWDDADGGRRGKGMAVPTVSDQPLPVGGGLLEDLSSGVLGRKESGATGLEGREPSDYGLPRNVGRSGRPHQKRSRTPDLSL